MSSNLEECIIFCIWLIFENLENLFDAFVLFLFAVVSKKYGNDVILM